MQDNKKEKTKDLPFESLLERLESVVKQLESGELSLESSLKIYEKGVELVRESQKRLLQMEGKIEQLMADGTKEPLPIPKGEM